ncbi:MAG TPA: PAS domain S-box protein, partial [Gemmatimonadales bacterium]|nr:PAS domain S-box protein [Gemmatimonadales bacterium]
MPPRRTGKAGARRKPKGPDYRLIFRQAPIPAYIAETGSTRILDVNQAAVERYGYTRAEFLRLTARDIRPPEDVARYDAFVAEQVPRRDAFIPAGLWRHRTRSGEVFDVEVSWARVQWKGRQAYIAFVRDLSVQRSAEAALRRWGTVFRAVSEAVIISDLDGALVDANPSAEALLGRRRPEMIGRPIGDWHAPGTATSEEVRSAAARTGYWSGPLRFVRPDGSVRVTDSTVVPLFDGEGQLYGYAGVNRDVTDQERVAESARSNHERLEAVITSSPLAMYVLDCDLVVQAWNPAAERIFGWSAVEAIGRVLPTLGPGDIAEARALVARVEAGGTLSRVELTRHRKDGSEVSISLSSAPLRDASGKLVGLSSIAEDVTEGRRMEAQLRQAQRMESVGRLSGGIAHDFNNLLTAILGSAELLRATLPEGSPELEEVNEIEKASRRAADLTRQLLAFSRQQMLAPAIVDPNDLLTELKRMLGRVVGEDIHFETRLRPGIGKVRADPGQLGQVVMNLVVNARDAMPEGGMLTIATALAELDERYVERHPGGAAGEFVVISVTDTGSGIP